MELVNKLITNQFLRSKVIGLKKSPMVYNKRPFAQHFHTGLTFKGRQSYKEPTHHTGSEMRKLLIDSVPIVDNKPLEEDDVWATSPYPKGAHPRDQSLNSLRPRVDPKETSIIFFPGQGTQFVGMGKNLLKFPTVQDLFDTASDVLGYNLKKLCVEGPEEKLNRTEYAQPAILVCSLAALERLKEEQPSAIENCIATAGFSLGELTALTFAEVISLEKALKLVKVRAEAMQAASDLVAGTMVSVMFGADAQVGKACEKAREFAAEQGVDHPYCGVSNYLYPHCKILAGHVEAIQYLEENKDEFGLRKVNRIPVSGAFHTPLMKPAEEAFRLALRKAKLQEPAIAVYSNVDGKLYRNSEHVRKQLPKQIVAPVRWEQTLHNLYERPPDMDFPRTFECGPGSGLSTILKMVNTKAWKSCCSIEA